VVEAGKHNRQLLSTVFNWDFLKKDVVALRTYIRASLITLTLLFISGTALLSNAFATECERPIKGETVHKFVIDKLGFDQKISGGRTSNGRTYLTSKASKYGSEKKPQTLPWEKWQEAIDGNPHPRWIWVPYTFDDKVYPTVKSSKGQQPLSTFLQYLVKVPSASERQTMIEEIYDLDQRAGASASISTAKSCSEKKLTGELFWKLVVEGWLRYKRGRALTDSGKIAVIYRAHRGSIATKIIGEKSHKVAVSDRKMTARSIKGFLLGHIGLSSTQVNNFIQRLKAIYYISER